MVKEKTTNKKYVNINIGQHKLYDLLIFIIGAISKIISTLITYPYTLIRTKQHINKNQTIFQTFLK